MKIDILCNDGSPLGVTPDTIYGDDKRVGVGGAELALLTLAEFWKSIGHEVRLYNNPWYLTDRLDQRLIATFNPLEERDILIIFRSPTEIAKRAKGKKVWWSCDQRTVGNFRAFGQDVDHIVTISDYHQDYFEHNYGLESTVLDLPIRDQDYLPFLDETKIKNRLIYTSVPGRGLDVLARAYPIIKQQVPDVSLVITSDYRLWGAAPGNSQYRSSFFGKDDVQFLGAVSRERLVEEQAKAEVLSYPCTYDELFCYAVAEAQWVGTVPVTTTIGSLATTTMGVHVGGEPSSPMWPKMFAEEVCNLLLDRKRLEDMSSYVKERAHYRFDITSITREWEKIFNG